MENIVFSTEFQDVIWPAYVTRSKATKKTILNLHQYLEKLIAFAKKDVCDINGTDATSFVEHLYQSIQKGIYQPSYVRVIYLSLRKFYEFLLDHRYELKDQGITVPSQNPFEEVKLRIPEKQLLTAADIPTIKDLDALLAGARTTNQSLYLSVCLAAKMGLSISEISNLRISSLGFMKEEYFYESIHGEHEANLYLCLPTKGKKTKRYLKVPEDLTEVINETLSQQESKKIKISEGFEEEDFEDFTREIDERNTDYPSYLITYKGKHYSERTMQFHLKNLCEELKIKPVTFAGLRNLAIFLMKQGGAKDSEIAHFTGQEGRWICRFAGIDPKQVFGTADYSQVQIVLSP